MLQLSNICRTFGTSATRVVALDNISLSIEKGDFTVITGQSGSGKSTLLQIIGLLDRASGGTYLLNGQDVGCLNDRQQSEFRLKNIGFIHQAFHLLPQESALSNVALPLGYMGYKRSRRLSLAKEALERVGLKDRIAHKPTQLSGGEQQRVAIARAIVTQPHLILADEPTGNLDSKNGAIIMELLRHLNKEGQTIVMVTHDKSIVQENDRQIVLHDGKIQFSR